MKQNNIDFIARRYRKNRFSADAGWRRLGVASVSIWKRYRVTAAIAATVILSATATIIYKDYHRVDNSRQETSTPIVSPLAEIKVIDFENAPLAEVVEKIETVYNVEVRNLPATPEEYELSLHYEGTPTDLIAVINDILDTQMIVVER